MRGARHHRAIGQVVDKAGGIGVEGVTVEAWDLQRFIARTSTNAKGQFAFALADNVLRALFGQRPPELTIKVLNADQVIGGPQSWKVGDKGLKFEVEGIAVPQPAVFALASDWQPAQKLTLKSHHHPMPRGTLGTIGRPVEVIGTEEFPETLLRVPYSDGLAPGIDATTARVFRWDGGTGTLKPVWNSGVNIQLGFAWAKIRRPGVYVVIGLPSDKLILNALAAMAYARRCNDLDTPAEREAVTRASLAPLLTPPLEAVEQLRQLVLRLESNTSIAPPSKDIQRGRAGYVKDITLPGGLSPAELRKHLGALETPPGGLPEEMLFYPPEIPTAEISADISAVPAGNLLNSIENLALWKWIDLHDWWPWLFGQDWWMYQANERHSGHAMGSSDIRSTNAGRMMLLKPTTTVAGPIYTKPAIVDGKIYVGSTESGTGGTLYKIDLYTGVIDGQYQTPTLAATYPIRGIGGSPAIVGGLAYFTSIHGRVYCIDTSTMSNDPVPPAPLWITDLKNSDSNPMSASHSNQPLDNPNADCWSGPLVINGNVYIGCGEGESAPGPRQACGFVYCLDARNGNVKWLFCTNQFQAGVDNQPNVVPQSLIPGAGLLAGYTSHADPPIRGASVWSSLAYCSSYNRVYVGTGNPQQDAIGPQALYSSGCISLDADTGELKGFWSPDPNEAYWPGDSDIDVPGGPTVYFDDGKWLVAIGSKSGAFVILDAGTMSEVARRQVLPRQNGDGTAANPGTPIPSVVPVPGPGGAENHYGIYGTPARGGTRLFVSLGSDGGIPNDPDGLGDPNKTPFMRTMDDGNLSDAWPTVTDGVGVTRYSAVGATMYQSNETGLGSAAVVNDVVFACTGLPASIYAFDASSGNPLWHDHTPSTDYCLGAAIYGNYVVIGAGASVRRYTLRRIIIPWPRPYPIPLPPVVSGRGPRSISIPASEFGPGRGIGGGGPVAVAGQIAQ